VTVEGVLLHVTIERRHLDGLFSETVTADSGKARSFILCGKKHEGICSNSSTSLKYPLLV